MDERDIPQSVRNKKLELTEKREHSNETTTEGEVKETTGDIKHTLGEVEERQVKDMMIGKSGTTDLQDNEQCTSETSQGTGESPVDGSKHIRVEKKLSCRGALQTKKDDVKESETQVREGKKPAKDSEIHSSKEITSSISPLGDKSQHIEAQPYELSHLNQRLAQDKDKSRNTEDSFYKEPVEGEKRHIRYEKLDIISQPKDNSPAESETRRLRGYLELSVFASLKWKESKCSINILYLLVLVLEVIKLGLVTKQMFTFGYDRHMFSEIVNRGHITLRHLLLKDWDATWETLPYPPAHGEFAAYDISHLAARINYAVEKFYNAENDAVGYFVRRNKDDLKIKMKYFDFLGFSNSNVKSDLKIEDVSFTVGNGLTQVIDVATKKTTYKYDIYKDFAQQNISQPLKRLLSIELEFTLHSARVTHVSRHVRCVRIQGWVTFEDLDNNGQVIVNLRTRTQAIHCEGINITVSPWVLERFSNKFGVVVISMCVLSMTAHLSVQAFSVFVYTKTKAYMKKYYRHHYKPHDSNEMDLPFSEYTVFVKMWAFLCFIADSFTLSSTVWIVFLTEADSWMLDTLDSKTMLLGLGCLLHWVTLLRFFRFHKKFNLLFKTMYLASADVAAYLLCTAVLFIGFWACGYVVLGPYHVKFQNPNAAFQTLLGMLNGDEIYATFAILQDDKVGTTLVGLFSSIYLFLFIAVFTIVVINLLIALFNSAYETLQDFIKEEEVERLRKNVGENENSLTSYFKSDNKKDRVQHLRASLRELMDNQQVSDEETKLRAELYKLCIDPQPPPRTLKSFIQGGKSDVKKSEGFCVQCIWPVFVDNETSTDTEV